MSQDPNESSIDSNITSFSSEHKEDDFNHIPVRTLENQIKFIFEKFCKVNYDMRGLCVEMWELYNEDDKFKESFRKIMTSITVANNEFPKDGIIDAIFDIYKNRTYEFSYFTLKREMKFIDEHTTKKDLMNQTVYLYNDGGDIKSRLISTFRPSTPQELSELLCTLTEFTIATKNVAGIKIVDTDKDHFFNFRDPIIMYLRENNCDDIKNEIMKLAYSFPFLKSEEGPLFSKELFPGLWFAVNPPNGQSLSNYMTDKIIEGTLLTDEKLRESYSAIADSVELLLNKDNLTCKNGYLEIVDKPEIIYAPQPQNDDIKEHHTDESTEGSDDEHDSSCCDCCNIQ